MDIGQNCIIDFGDNGTAKIRLVAIDTYSSMPSDYWFEYREGETNKQLIHPDYNPESKGFIKAEILLPYGLVNRVVKIEHDEDSYEYRFEKYVNGSSEMRSLLTQLERLSGRDYIEEKYLKSGE